MNMQILITTWNKLQHRDAADWFTISQAREEKKQLMQSETVVMTQEETTQAVSQGNHVVFTHADLGHNPEEKSQIQQLYNDLQRVGFAPRLALG